MSVLIHGDEAAVERVVECHHSVSRVDDTKALQIPPRWEVVDVLGCSLVWGGFWGSVIQLPALMELTIISNPSILTETVAEGVVKSDLPVADVDNREALIGPVKPQRKRPVTSSLVSAASHVGAPSVPGRGRRSSKILHLLQLFLYGCVGQKFTTPGCKLGAFVSQRPCFGL